MRIAIRADASVAIGSGHVMRCLTLAEGLRREGGEVRFLCRQEPGHLAELIRQRGFGCDLLPADLDWKEDAARCAELLAAGLDLLLVDHYRLDARWESALRPQTRALAVIDDLADRDHDCDLLLDQNLLPNMEQRYQDRVPAGCRLLLGPEYALLREEFHRLAAALLVRDGQLHRLLLFFGGADPGNLTGRALDELAGLPLGGDVVIGSSNPHQAGIESRCRESGGRWQLHVQTERMAELMAGADLALGAGGSSHWERCRLGLPALVVTVAENQVPTTRLLHQRGACRWLGSVETLPAGVFRQSVELLTQYPGQLLAMSRAAQEILPAGGGTARVVGEISQLLAATAQESNR